MMVAFFFVSGHGAKGNPSEGEGMNRAVIEVCDESAPRVGMFSNDPVMNYGVFLNREVYLFDPKKYTYNPPPNPIPAAIDGEHYFQLEKSRSHRFRVVKPGQILLISPKPQAVIGENRVSEDTSLGAEKVSNGGDFVFNQSGSDVPFSLSPKQVEAGEEFETPAGVIVAGFSPLRNEEGELLYNGIRLPKKWPPVIPWNSKAPIEVPYLENPPRLIPINVGRQLFIDDYLVETVQRLEREYHYPEKLAGNPVLKAETSLEQGGTHKNPVAAPKSGGLWWNPQKNYFELWYEAGWLNTLAYATSKDGIQWERPSLQVNPPTNQVLPPGVAPDSVSVIKDYQATNPDEAYKMFLRSPGCPRVAMGYLSRDGLSFGKPIAGGVCGDRSTMFYNPFRDKWVYSLRWANPQTGRARYYWESSDFIKGIQWTPDDPVPWARTDKLDLPDPMIGNSPQLYNLDAVAYESIMLGFFQLHHGPENEVVAAKGLPKNTGLNFAYSRDGFHWSRPDRTMAINSEKRDVWDRGYVQSLGNICTVRGDEIWFYYIGFAGDTERKVGDPGVESSNDSGLYANGATGVAVLRRDGFVSFNAEKDPGNVLTRPVSFSGKHLFVNLDAPEGSLIAEVEDISGNPIEPFSFGNCIPANGNSTLIEVRWKGADDLSSLANRPVRFRFKLQTGKLYSFWVSRDQSGRSDGYVAGGGPGYLSNIDTVGKAALEADRASRK